MNVRRLLSTLILLVAFPVIYAGSVYYIVYNPNDYPLTDYQIRIDLGSDFPALVNQPLAQVVDVDTGQPLNFCYELNEGACLSTVTDSGVIWVKVDNIPAKDQITLRIDYDGTTNGAVGGDQVFDFYDDMETQGGWVLTTGTVLDYSTTVVHSGSYSLHLSGSTAYKLFDTTLSGSYVLEGWDYIAGDATISAAALVGSSSNIWVNLYAGGNVIRIGDSSGTLAESSANIPTYDWMFFRLKVYEDGRVVAEAYYNGQLIGSASASSADPKIFDRITLTGTSPGDHYFDDLRIRKLVDQEPLITPAIQYATVSKQSTSTVVGEFTQQYWYVKQLYIIGINSVSTPNVAVPIIVDTQTWISEGKLQSDCSDLYVTYYDPVDGREEIVPYFVDKQTCNTKNTVIYVKVPQLSTSDDYVFYIYHGVSGLAFPIEDPKNTFYFFVDLSDSSDVSNNLDIFTSGTASYEVTSSGIHVVTGSDGYVVIYNK